MLDITKIQADIAESRERIEQSRTRLEQDIAESRERIAMDLAESRSRMDKNQAAIEQMRLANDKYLAETENLRKQTGWFPYIQIITTLLTGGLVVFVLTRLLQ